MPAQIVLPGATIGILGGGQLGRMTAIEAKKMGYDVVCLDPAPDSPCGQVADDRIVAPLDDLAAAISLAERSDVLIYEFENIDIQIVEELEKKYNLPQKSRILGIAQNRTAEKTELQKAGFPVAPFRIVGNIAELGQGVAELGYPCVLKTARGGYDGKGQMVLNDAGDLITAGKMLSSARREWVLEKKIAFTHEVSVIVARKENGAMAAFPVAENIHRENILYMSVVPARVSAQVEQEAIALTEGIAARFEVVGLLAVEFFVTPQGLLVNELAPRPHNSGHYTWDACYTSQFEQFIRAVCGLPLGNTRLMTPVVMVNILGADLPRVLEKMPDFTADIKIHIYGKRGHPEPKRKMGHLTITSDCPDQAVQLISKIFA